jgi:hypothetical protein
MHEPLRNGRVLNTATQNTILKIPRQADEISDQKLIRAIGKELNQITADSDAFEGEARTRFITSRYEEIERRWKTS